MKKNIDYSKFYKKENETFDDFFDRMEKEAIQENIMTTNKIQQMPKHKRIYCKNGIYYK